MSESRVRENRTHGSMRRREAARCRWPSGPKGRGASRRPYGALSRWEGGLSHMPRCDSEWKRRSRAGDQDRQHADVIDVSHGEHDHGGDRGVGAWLRDRKHAYS
jgi:hypothetical protein